MVNVGLLGAGRIGAVHASAYSALGNAQLVAVADVNRTAADRLASEHRARAYYLVEDLLEDERIDMVDVCLPTFLHERAVTSAAEAGKHILCEKPIARTLGEVDRMIEAVERAGVKAMVAQVTRFWPEYIAIKELLEGNELGRPLIATATRLESMTRMSDWFRDPGLSGGAVLDIHVHDLDYLFWLFGKPRSVYAVGQTSETGAWDHVVTTLDYGDVKATIEGSFLMPPAFSFTMTFRLLGDKGCVEYRRQGAVEEQADREPELILYQHGEPVYPVCSDKDAYLAEIEYFVDCVNSGRAPEVATLPEARTVLRIALAAKESMETGRVIALSAE